MISIDKFIRRMVAFYKYMRRYSIRTSSTATVGHCRWPTLSKATFSWWRHQMEIFSALLAICAWNSPASGEFPAQRPVTWSFNVFFDLCLNKRLRKQSWGWWFETLSCPLWRHRNVRANNTQTRSAPTEAAAWAISYNLTKFVGVFYD